jgi:hypothetical protein
MDGLLQKSLMAGAALAIAVGAWISGARAESNVSVQIPASFGAPAVDASSNTDPVAGNSREPR